jgi:signal transduction histidine kinase
MLSIMKGSGSRSVRFLLVASALVLFSAIALLWVVVVREAQRKDILIEYEAFRASSAFVDEFRRDQSFSPTVDPRVLGFGFYTLEGVALRRYGTAPAVIAVDDRLWNWRSTGQNLALPGRISVAFSENRKTLRLLRYSGVQNPGRMNGQMQGMGRNRMGQEAIPPASSNLFATNYLIWMEYTTAGFQLERLQLQLAAVFVSAALAGLYVMLIRVYRRNENLRAREAETRELVQLGEAARTLAHEIKNPLGIMRIQTSRIRKAVAPADSAAAETSLPPDPRQDRLKNAIDIIDGEILRLSGLVDRIREFLKPGPASLEILDLRDFLASYCARYRELKDSGIEFELESLAPGPALVRADREKLLNALDNLLANAIEAVEAQAPGRRSITVKLFARQESWVIAILDTGDGIPEATERRIFDPFFTTKEKGSGIGLSLSRRMVESFGGGLSYEGKADGERGAVFTLRMARVKEGHRAQEA